MIIWLSGGFIVWILCVLFMLAIIKGGHRIRGNVYEQKLYLQSMANTQDIKIASKSKCAVKTMNGKEVVDRRVTDRRVTERRSIERRITEGSIADRIITEGVPIIKRLKQRRLGGRRNMEFFDWQVNPSLN